MSLQCPRCHSPKVASFHHAMRKKEKRGQIYYLEINLSLFVPISVPFLPGHLIAGHRSGAISRAVTPESNPGEQLTAPSSGSISH